MNNGSNYSSGYAELTGNVWHHIAGVGDNTDKSLKIYVDGVLRNSGSFTGSPTATTNNLVIGALAGARYVNGVIDEVRIYNRSLSGDEIGKLYSLYSERYTYSAIGNIASKDGVAYSYGGPGPHAVTQVGSTNYVYDANGNMTNRGAQALTWDVENRLTGVTGSAAFIYDGDGKRVKKTEGGITTVYVNKYYEKNLNTGESTLYYYLGDRLVALKKVLGQNSTLRYLSQDHLTGTSVTSDATTGNLVASIKYAPFGDRRNSTGAIDTDRQFTGQRLDGTGLYYYGARYYDPGIGRFISPDKGVQMSPGVLVMSAALTVQSATAYPVSSEAPKDPQALNRYTYVFDNPLKYTDADGRQAQLLLGAIVGAGAYIVTTVGANVYSHRQEGVKSILNHALDGGNTKDFLVAMAMGAATSGLSAGITAATVLSSRTAPIVAGAVSSEAQYAIDVLQGKKKPSRRVALGVASLGGFFGSIDPILPELPQAASIGPGIVAATTEGVITDVTTSNGSTSEFTRNDSDGTPQTHVSINGGEAMWISISRANEKLNAGVDLVYVR